MASYVWAHQGKAGVARIGRVCCGLAWLAKDGLGVAGVVWLVGL